jgi:hypothetical protein
MCEIECPNQDGGHFNLLPIGEQMSCDVCMNTYVRQPLTAPQSGASVFFAVRLDLVTPKQEEKAS